MRKPQHGYAEAAEKSHSLESLLVVASRDLTTLYGEPPP